MAFTFTNSSELKAAAEVRALSNIASSTQDTVAGNVLPVANRNGSLGTATNSSFVANNAVAPDGSTTAGTLTATAGAATHYITTIAGTIPAHQQATGRAWIFSGYLKPGTATWAATTGDAGGNQGETWFNLSTGQIGTKNAGNMGASFVSVGSGWYNFAVGFQNGAGNFPLPFILISNANNTNSFTAAGTETLQIWGCSLVPFPIGTNTYEGFEMLVVANLASRNAF